jgi:hypothetical protein
MTLTEGPTVAKLASKLSKMLHAGSGDSDLSAEIRSIASQHGEVSGQEEHIRELAKALSQSKE